MHTVEDCLFLLKEKYCREWSFSPPLSLFCGAKWFTVVNLVLSHFFFSFVGSVPLGCDQLRLEDSWTLSFIVYVASYHFIHTDVVMCMSCHCGYSSQPSVGLYSELYRQPGFKKPLTFIGKHVTSYGKAMEIVSPFCFTYFLVLWKKEILGLSNCLRIWGCLSSQKCISLFHEVTCGQLCFFTTWMKTVSGCFDSTDRSIFLLVKFTVFKSQHVRCISFCQAFSKQCSEGKGIHYSRGCCGYYVRSIWSEAKINICRL